MNTSILVGLSVLLAGLVPSTTTYTASHEAVVVNEVIVQPRAVSSETEAINEALERHFGENPAVLQTMKAIATCESNLRQFDRDGSVLISRLGTLDKGIFQVHEPIWGKKAKELGYDIDSIEGNVLMAKHILQTQGLTAWKPSSSCSKPIIDRI